MNLIIFGGFLGSGKTSLILSLALFIADRKKTSDGPGLVIIENEIGETGIDDKVLKSGGFSVRELFSGCICCQLTVDLTTTLNDIAEKINPEWVIIESTGLAYPGKILGTLSKYGKGIDSIRTVTVVDAERWDELTAITPVLIETQVVEGDTVLINKIDLVTEEELKHVDSYIAELNPKARIYKVSASGRISESIWREVTGINE